MAALAAAAMGPAKPTPRLQGCMIAEIRAFSKASAAISQALGRDAIDMGGAELVYAWLVADPWAAYKERNHPCRFLLSL
jgi:hypothetical protein